MITSQTNRHFIEAEVYSQFILENMQDGLLPTQFYRNVSDFQTGETLNIKTIGEATIQFVEEDKPVVFSPIESGLVTMQIDQYVGDAWSITDVAYEDVAQIEVLKAMRAKESTRAIQEYFESKAMSTVYEGAKANLVDNNINGFSHYGAASGTGGTVELNDFIRMKLAFDKAEVPMGGRIVLVDPVVAASLDTKFNAGYDVNRNSEIMEWMKNGFDRDHQFVTNLFGWNVITTNRLPSVAAIATTDKKLDGTAATAVTTGASKPCLFMNIADDQTKCLMSAWRSQPKVESDRNVTLARDEFVTRCRFGFGLQRYDTLGVLLASDSNV